MLPRGRRGFIGVIVVVCTGRGDCVQQVVQALCWVILIRLNGTKRHTRRCGHDRFDIGADSVLRGALGVILWDTVCVCVRVCVLGSERRGGEVSRVVHVQVGLLVTAASGLSGTVTGGRHQKVLPFGAGGDGVQVVDGAVRQLPDFLFQAVVALQVAVVRAVHVRHLW